jgi:dihydroorotate dehydrogenase
VYDLVFRVFSLFPAEPMHELVFGGLSALMKLRPLESGTNRWLAASDPTIAVSALGTVFPSPLGLAAGFDKNARAPQALLALGFGFVEVGSVTPRAQPGNPKPRLFRLKRDRALLNRMGFNNDGAVAVAARLAKRPSPLVAVNIGKNKSTSEADAPSDYREAARLLGAHAAFLVVNVSSPNTAGLRDLQASEALTAVLKAAREGLEQSGANKRVPLLVKIAPDLSDDEVDAIAEVALQLGVDGIVATNTTIARSGLQTDAEVVAELGNGGLSGPLLKERSRQILARLYRKVGRSMVLISVGGIDSAEEAWARIVNGATLLELYTSFIYEGPLVAYRIHRGLAARVRQAGFSSISEAVGSAVRAMN